MTEMPKEEEFCGEPRQVGSWSLFCERKPHADDGGWHEATVTDHREMTAAGVRHVVESVEQVSWEPVDRVLRKALRPLRKQIAERDAPAGDET